MKKLFFMMGIAAMMSVSCLKENLPSEETKPEFEYNTVLKASISEDEKPAPEPKATVSENYKKLSWSAGDRISVYTSAGRFVDFVYDGTESAEVASFKGKLEEGETVAQYAVYPAGNHKVDNGALKVNLPAEYVWKKDQVPAVLTAALTTEDEVVTFKHVGGVFAFDLKEVQAGADRFTFSTSAGITGDFSVEEGVINAVAETDGEVTFTFDKLQQATDMRFFVPVPVGAYDGFTVTVFDGEQTKSVRSSELENKIERTTLAKFSFVAPGFIYVSENGSADADGSSWENATTLTAALASAVDGDVIRIAGGTYVPEALISGVAQDAPVQHKTFHVKKNLTIQGSYNAVTGQIDTAATPTVISGKLSETESAYHTMVVAVPPGTGKVVLKGLTFTQGAGKIMSVDGEHSTELATSITTSEEYEIKDYQGAGLYAASRVHVESCTFTENTADQVYNGTNVSSGAGMILSSTAKNSVVNRCSFTSNSAALAGGLTVQSTGSEVRNSYFSANTAVYGGAYSNHASTTIRNCKFVENATEDFGGAVRAFSTLRIYDSEFADNSTEGNGGAIQSNRQTVAVEGCSFTGNTATNGGAIANWGGGIMTVTDCVFNGNEATGNGGAIINMYQNKQDRFSRLTVSGSTFTGNKCTGSGYTSVGGALANQLAIAVVKSCTFTGNSAPHGAAIHSHDTNPNGNAQYVTEGDFTKASFYMYNSLLADNTTSGQGALRVIGTGSAVIVNTTITGSTSTAGAIRTRENTSNVGGNIWLINSTLSGNSTGFFDQGFASNVYNTVLYGNSTTGYGDYAYNNTRGTNVLKSVVNGSEYRGKAISDATRNLVYASDGSSVSSPTFAEGWLGTYNATLGVFPVTGAPGATGGMPYETLAATGERSIAAEITAVMPDFEAKYLTQDQKGNSRQGKTVMGAYVGQ